MMFVRFLAVGIVNTAVGLAITYGAKHGLDWAYWPSTLVGWIAGAFVSFRLNRRYTFRSGTPSHGVIVRFGTVTVGSYLLAYSSSYRIAERASSLLGLTDDGTADLAVLLGMAAYTVLNYLGQKYFVFRQSRKSSFNQTYP